MAKSVTSRCQEYLECLVLWVQRAQDSLCDNLAEIPLAL